MKNITIPCAQLRQFGDAIFRKMGCSAVDAKQATDVLLKADLRGVDSHGFARLGGYVRLWEAGRINITPHVEVTYETPSTAVVDGDSGMGLVVAPEAMKIAIKKAHICGTGWIAVRNSNHFGIAGYHAMKALDENMIGIAMTNASPLVAPTFSTERLLGTNPICVAIPAGQQPPFVADFATTTAANGKLEILQQQHRDAPMGWVQRKDGSSTTNAHELKEGGALTPLGSDCEHASHKGFCLGAWVDIFSAVLSGANYGPWVPPFVNFLSPPPDPVGQGVGHFFGALRVDAFRPVTEFKKNMDNWIKRFRSANPIKGKKGVVIPGDPERAHEVQRAITGIPLNPKVVADLENIGANLDVPFIVSSR